MTTSPGWAVMHCCHFIVPQAYNGSGRLSAANILTGAGELPDRINSDHKKGQGISIALEKPVCKDVVARGQATESRV